MPFLDRKRGFYGVYAMRESANAAPGATYPILEQSLTTFVRSYAGLVVDELRAAPGE